MELLGEPSFAALLRRCLGELAGSNRGPALTAAYGPSDLSVLGEIGISWGIEQRRKTALAAGSRYGTPNRCQSNSGGRSQEPQLPDSLHPIGEIHAHIPNRYRSSSTDRLSE